MSSKDITSRKQDHIRIAASGQASFRGKTSLLEEVDFVHQSLPEMALSDVDLTTTFLGSSLSAPLVIAGMTGGTEEAGAINSDLARAAEKFGLGFGVGSQRAMAEDASLGKTFAVRDAAPNVFLMGNIGAVQARDLGIGAIEKLVGRLGANALAIHLNPAQELVQENGDRNFSGLLDVIGELVKTLSVPVVVKETGCGISPDVAKAVKALGGRAVDVSGAGGTSWTAVEALRAGEGSAAQDLGEELWDWGIPTAVSTAACAKEGLEVVATGGLRSGLDVVRALALGATCGGFAAPILRAHRSGGYDAVCEGLTRLIASIRAVCLLVGCKSVQDISSVQIRVGPQLSSWLHDLGIR